MDHVVIFDRTCSLCAQSVMFILGHESDRVLRFAALQSHAGSRLMREFGIDPAQTETFVLIEGGRAFVKSDAALRVAKHLRRPWHWLGVVRIVPRPVRDLGYDLVARNRHRWCGRVNACLVPTAEFRARFMEE